MKKRTRAKRKQKAEPVEQVLVSVSEAAEAFGHHRQTIAKRIRARGVRPGGTRRGHAVYRLRDLLEIERSSPGALQDPDTMAPLERLAHFRAESESLRVDDTRGELVEREAADREWRRVLSVIDRELVDAVPELEREFAEYPAIAAEIRTKFEAIRELIAQAKPPDVSGA